MERVLESRTPRTCCARVRWNVSYRHRIGDRKTFPVDTSSETLPCVGSQARPSTSPRNPRAFSGVSFGIYPFEISPSTGFTGSLDQRGKGAQSTGRAVGLVSKNTRREKGAASDQRQGRETSRARITTRVGGGRSRPNSTCTTTRSSTTSTRQRLPRVFFFLLIVFFCWRIRHLAAFGRDSFQSGAPRLELANVAARDDALCVLTSLRAALLKFVLHCQDSAGHQRCDDHIARSIHTAQHCPAPRDHAAFRPPARA